MILFGSAVFRDRKRIRMLAASDPPARIRGPRLPRRRARFAFAALLASALFFAAWPALGQLPQARLSSIFPPGGKVNSTFEVTVHGQDLDDATEIRFSHPDITAKPKMLDAAFGEPDPNRFVVTIGSTVPPGVYEARVAGRFGVSNPRAFAVGDLPESLEPGDNTSADKPAELPLDQIVNGRAAANAIDHYRIKATQGKRLLIRCQTKEIDSRLDPVLLLYDRDGRELERSRRGGLIDFTAPADGEFIVKVHDFLFRGGEDYFYRLSAGTSPHIDFIWPPAGAPGAKAAYTVYGRNLPGGSLTELRAVDGRPLEKVEVEIPLPSDAPSPLERSSVARPAEAVLDGVDYHLKNSSGASNPIFISFATAPVVLEQEPNDAPDSAQQVSLPAEVVGQFFPKGDRDWFRFHARKGETYWIELFSQRLGLPTDPFLLVQRVTKNEKGEEKTSDVQELYDFDVNLGGVEFNTATRDPAWRFEVKEDGLYQVQVRDLFNRSQDNPALVYRLSLRKESPDYRLVALTPAPPPPNRDQRPALPWSAVVRRGETLPLKVLLFRRDNFTGEVRVAVEGLPPNVRCSETKVPAGQTYAWLMLTADETAQDWLGSIRVVAQTADGAQKRYARAGAIIWNVADYNNEAVQSRLARDFLLAVSGQDAAPLQIAAAEDKLWETSVAAKLQIPVKVTRRGEFNGPVKLRAMGLPALDSMNEIEIAAKAETGALELNLAQVKLPPGQHTIHLIAQTQGKLPRRSAEEIKELQAQLKATEDSLKELAEAKKPLAQARVKRLKEAIDKAQAKETTVTFYSGPVRLHVAAAPLKLSVGASQPKIEQGAKLELPVSIQRLFGFAEAVELSLVVPGDVKGLKAAKVSVPKDRASAVLDLEAERTATIGEHALAIRANLKFNDQNLQMEESFRVRVVTNQQAKN